VRKLIAIMFTDIEGYTRIMGENEQLALSILRQNRDNHKVLVQQYHGQLLKEMGDGILASFENSSDAVICAAAIQKASIEKDIALRVGIHMGEVIFENNDVFGDGVNIASRIQELGVPGQILISETIRNNIQNKPGITTELVGERELKNVEKALVIYQAVVKDAYLTPRTKDKKKKLMGPWVIASAGILMLLFGLSGYWIGLKSQDTPAPNPVLRYNIDLEFPLGRTGRHAIKFSPDGKHLCYVSANRLYLKALDDPGNGVPLSGVWDPRDPSFSPDGQWIVFDSPANSQLMKIPVTGGNAQFVCSLKASAAGINWYEGWILFCQEMSFYRVNESGGTPEKIYPKDTSRFNSRVRDPQFLPDNKTIIYNQSVQGNDPRYSILKIVDIEGNSEPENLIEGVHDARYLRSGHIAFMKEGSLQVVRFDENSKKIIGTPRIVISDPLTFSGPYVGQFDFNSHGTLVYYRGRFDNESARDLVWIDFSGNIEKITREPGMFMSPKISRNGQQIVVDLESGDDHYDITLFNPTLGTSTNFVTSQSAITPAWHPDNVSIAYFQFDEPRGVYLKPVDHSYTPRLLFETDEIIHLGNWSNDGRFLLFRSPSGIGYYDQMDSTAKFLDFIQAEEGEEVFYPALSPDGNWLSYTSDDEGNQDHVYVVPFPGPGQAHRLSIDEGFAAIWAPDMSSIYFIGQNAEGFNVSRTFISTKPYFSSSEPEILFKGNYTARYQFTNSGTYQFGNTGIFDIHPDGDRFLMQERLIEDKAASTTLHFIVNWQGLITD
jgi:Tol biopolymer transport system component